MPPEGFTGFVLLAIVYSIVVEHGMRWLLTKHIVTKMKGGWGRFFLIGFLFLVSRVFLPVVIVVYVEGSSLASMGLHRPNSVWVFLAVPIAFLSLIVISLLEDTYRVRYLEKDPEELIRLHTPANYRIELINQLILAGLPEEFLYRGYFVSRLLFGFGAIPSILLSSLYFGLVHNWSIVKGEKVGDKYKVLRTFLGGIVFATMFVHFGLAPCIILHICLNLSYGWISKIALPKLTMKIPDQKKIAIHFRPEL